jgi:hypothetical protein
MDAALLIEGGDWFGTDGLAAGSMHVAVRDIRIDHANRGLNKRTAVVDLSDDAICMVTMVGLDSFARPTIW